MGRRSDIDWEKIAGEYRAGHLTLDQIAKNNGVSVSSITLKAKNGGWKRDLSKAVEQATRAALIEKSVLRADEIGKEIGRISAGKAISAVEAAATVRVMVLEKHQLAAAKVQNILNTLADEVTMLNGNPTEIAQLILAVGQNDPAAAGEIQKMAALPSRTMTVKNIVDALGKATEIERKAHGIKDDEGEKNNSVDEFLLKLAGMTN